MYRKQHDEQAKNGDGVTLKNFSVSLHVLNQNSNQMWTFGAGWLSQLMPG